MRRLWLVIGIWTIFGITTLLTGCGDPAVYPFEVVTHVAAVGDGAYAHVVRRQSWGPGCCPYGERNYYASYDEGLTWEMLATDVPQGLVLKLKQASQRWEQACEPDAPMDCLRVNGLGEVQESGDGGETWWQGVSYPWNSASRKLARSALDLRSMCSQTSLGECYRISEQGLIESSTDAGVTWRNAWSPPGQASLRNLRTRAGGVLQGVTRDVYPLDLAILDSADGFLVLAAMGNQGILRRTLDGTWEAIAVGDAYPEGGMEE